MNIKEIIAEKWEEAKPIPLEKYFEISKEQIEKQIKETEARLSELEAKKKLFEKEKELKEKERELKRLTSEIHPNPFIKLSKVLGEKIKEEAPKVKETIHKEAPKVKEAIQKFIEHERERKKYD